jgi:hypothetical protein
MTISLVGQRLVCSECSVTRCLESDQNPLAFEPTQMHFLTRLDAYALEHLHGAPRPERLRSEAVRPHPCVPATVMLRRRSA